MQIDVRDLLPRDPRSRADLDAAGRRRGSTVPPTGHHIAGTHLVVFDGVDHVPWAGDQDKVIAEFERFLSGLDEDVALDRVLATVLFTDIVRSTEHAVELGDRSWRRLVDEHDARVRAQLARFRGREIRHAGDRILRYVRRAGSCNPLCLRDQRVRARSRHRERAGLHTGECELAEDRVRGIAVHVDARVAARAAPGEVLVSSTVRDLVAGSGLRFEDRGTDRLKGIPEPVHTYAVVPVVPTTRV